MADDHAYEDRQIFVGNQHMRHSTKRAVMRTLAGFVLAVIVITIGPPIIRAIFG